MTSANFTFQASSGGTGPGAAETPRAWLGPDLQGEHQLARHRPRHAQRRPELQRLGQAAPSSAPTRAPVSSLPQHAWPPPEDQLVALRLREEEVLRRARHHQAVAAAAPPPAVSPLAPPALSGRAAWRRRRPQQASSSPPGGGPSSRCGTARPSGHRPRRLLALPVDRRAAGRCVCRYTKTSRLEPAKMATWIIG